MPPFPSMWRVGLTFDLPLTYFWGKAFLSYQLHNVWESDMTYDLDLWPTDLNINRGHLLIKDYLPSKFEASEAKLSGVISCTWAINMTFDLDLLPTDLNINRGHLLILDYVPTKFEACGTKNCWVISCTRYRKSTWPLTLTFDLTWISIAGFLLYLDEKIGKK